MNNKFAEKNIKKFTIIIEKGADGFFIAHCPTLRSCWSQGITKEEALSNIREAIELFPEPEPEDFKTNKNHGICEVIL